MTKQAMPDRLRTLRHPLGPSVLPDGSVHFLAWAPLVESSLELRLLDQDATVTMTPLARGYYSAHVPAMQPGERYLYRIDGDKQRPDPTSRAQPEGVHGPSALIDAAFPWDDKTWSPPTLRNSVFYELHVGTYTPEGTFTAIIPHLARLRALGVTTLQLMPIAAFPGARNWGYDGVHPYAAHEAYGGAEGLRQLVNAAHQQDMAVFLDVVYNHLGPEGNYLWDYGHYFTDRYHAGWGDAFNLDGPHSDEVRRYFIENALYWLRDCHVDGLRLDATHALYDFSARPFLQELAASVHDWAQRANRRVTLIAENDKSDRRLTLPLELGGTGIDGQWLDDFHHVVHNALTGETDGYYADYGDFKLFTKVLREGFAYTGQYSPFRQRRHGTPSADLTTDRFVVATQNHDQVGNRMLGERLSHLTDFDGLKLAAGLLLLSPYVPMLFMGQEYAETAPFLYFVSHQDENLVHAVREGRKKEFEAFAWQGTPPDPQDEATFQRSKLNHALREDGHHRQLYELYTTLLALRREHPALTNPERAATHVYADDDARIIALHREHPAGPSVRLIANWHLHEAQSLTLPPSGQRWTKIFDSGDARWRPEGVPNTSAPAELVADEPLAIALPPKHFAVYLETPSTEHETQDKQV